MTTTDWPEGATPKEELTERQIKVIKVAAKNPDVNSPSKLAELCDRDDVSRTYPQSVIRRNWPNRYWVDVDDSNNNNNTPARSRAVSDSDIENIRRMALNGLKAGEIADKRDVGTSTIQAYLKGNRGDDSKSSIPPLEYNFGNSCWEVPEDDDSKEQTMLDTTPDDGREENHVNEEREITAPESDAGPKAKTVAVVGAFIGFVVGFAIKTLGDSE